MLLYLLLIGRKKLKRRILSWHWSTEKWTRRNFHTQIPYAETKTIFSAVNGQQFKKKSDLLKPPVNGKTIIIKREAELMDPIKANTKSPEALQHKQSKVNSVIPQVSLTSTQFKETSI